MNHAPKKRPRKIAEAVFRGRVSEYRFDVFPIAGELTDSAGVYILSHRFTDKFRHAHHSVVCIGECASILKELKRHRRAKCARDGDANVICLLRDDDEKSRSAAIADITAARSFTCVRNAIVTRNSKLPAAKRSSGAIKPAVRAKNGAVRRETKVTRKPIITEPQTPRQAAPEKANADIKKTKLKNRRVGAAAATPRRATIAKPAAADRKAANKVGAKTRQRKAAA